MEQQETLNIKTVWMEAAVIVVAVALAALGVRHVIAGETVNSRMATVWSLTKHGTWCLDRPVDEPRNPFEAITVDKVAVRGRLISSKPPMIPLIMTGEYLLLRGLFGWDLENRDHLKSILQVMNLTLVVFAYAIALIFFAKILRLFVENPWRRLFWVAAMAFCTQVFGYSSQLNNHVPAVGMLMPMLYFGIGLSSGKLTARPWRFFMFGLCGALVFTFDLPITIFVALTGLYLLYCHPRNTLIWTTLGVAGPLLVHFAIMTAVTGSPLPVQLNKDCYLFESSMWRNPMGLDSLNEPKLVYLFHFTFGRHGVFLLFPILITGLLGGVLALLRRDVPGRGYVLGGAMGFLLISLYYLLNTHGYGGEAYGFRWYIGAMPVLLLMGASFHERVHSRWLWGVLFALAVASAYSAWECHQNPWGADLEWTARLLFGPSH